jgi:hypothetical protein
VQLVTIRRDDQGIAWRGAERDDDQAHARMLTRGRKLLDAALLE